jgi:hypothetical protein
VHRLLIILYNILLLGLVEIWTLCLKESQKAYNTCTSDTNNSTEHSAFRDSNTNKAIPDIYCNVYHPNMHNHYIITYFNMLWQIRSIHTVLLFCMIYINIIHLPIDSRVFKVISCFHHSSNPCISFSTPYSCHKPYQSQSPRHQDASGYEIPVTFC